MIEQFIIFTKRGIVLYNKELTIIEGHPVNGLIQKVLLEERGESESIYECGTYGLKWCFDHGLDLVFVVVYQKILQLLYLDELLQQVKENFIDSFKSVITKTIYKRIDYEETFTKMLRDIEMSKGTKKGRVQRTFNEKKGKGVAESSKGNKNKKTLTKEVDEDDEEDTDDDDGIEVKDSKESSLTVNLKEVDEDEDNDNLDPEMRAARASLAMRNKAARTQRKGGKSFKKIEDEKPAKKEGREWGGTADKKLSKKDMQALDFSKDKTEKSDIDSIEKDSNIGTTEVVEQEKGTLKPLSANKGWSSTFTSIFSTITGNKIIQATDLVDILETMRKQLIGKNVAVEIADELCETVGKKLVGGTLTNFTRVKTAVQAAFEESIFRILQPKKSIDVLRSALEAKEEGRPYVAVFVGVNGVGKSTSLSKVAYYFMQKDLKVMVAACDTFRAGAVEQLKVHGKRLGVEIFDRGYSKDPAAVAREAVKYAALNGIDVVLVDTAGRMQNNNSLMNALAQLINKNNPDLVLFVGEALVGNDGVDQLREFNRALADMSDAKNPRLIDGIVLTKFDTIDDKVGAALSMVHQSGQPIIFVGTGQKYTNLRRLNVDDVVNSLLA